MQRAPEVGLLPAGPKAFARLRSSSTLRFSPGNPLHVIASQHACACSPATTLHSFPIENRWILFPVLQRFFDPQHPALPLAKNRRTSQTESAFHSRTSGLARLLPARAAWRTLITSLVEIK
jgi:hypothetical protein